VNYFLTILSLIVEYCQKGIDKYIALVYYNYMVEKIRKPLTKFQLAKRDRDLLIKVFYQNLPPGLRTMQRVAKVFDVSIATVCYAVNGRVSAYKKKKG